MSMYCEWKPLGVTNINALMAPESIAVVGASPDSWYASNLIENLQDYGYDGELFYVNPNRETVWGDPCYDSLSDVPVVVDLVVVNVPRQYVIDTITEAGDMGVPAALVITAGFAEADEKGTELEAELADQAEEYDMAVCGPNTIGFANMHDEIVVTSTCSRQPGKGSIGLVSQSGALAFTTFYERAADEDIDFAYIVATGNEANLSVADYVDYMAGDDRVDVICAYIEGIDDPREFIDAAGRAIRNGTPVLVTKVGASSVAQQATMSHTGSITGNNAAWEAAFEQTGIQRVPDIPDLLSRSKIHTAFDQPESSRVCIASTSGGMASLLADMAADRDLELPAMTGETEQALLDMEDLLTFGELHNPIDIRGYGADVLPEIGEIVFDDDRYDMYVFAIGLSAVNERAESIADDMQTVQQMTDDPVVFLWTGRKEPEDGQAEPVPYQRVREQMPLYYDPGTCMDAVKSLAAFNPEQQTDSRASVTITEMPEQLPESAVLTWKEATDLLQTAGIEPVETRRVTTANGAVDAVESVGAPAVLKVDARDIPHRTDAGAVKTDVTPETAADTYRTIIDNATEYTPNATIESVLVQRQITAPQTTEMLVGVSQDQNFGPVITVAPGGELVELFGEEASMTFVPPVSPADVNERLADTPVGDLLAGYRETAPRDIDALAKLVSAVGDLVTADTGPNIAELDLNPVLVHSEGDGVSIVDVLVRTGSQTTDS